MSEPAALLAALQLADSALPIGRFVHSHGLEAWLHAHPHAPPDRLAELVETVICESVAPLDGAFAAHTHRTDSLARVLALDERLTARKFAPSARAASRACGRQLAALAPQLAPGDSLVAEVVARVRARESDGNLAVVAGTLARALAITEHDTVLVELRGAASALLSAAVRLGALAPTRAQVVLAQLVPALATAAARACTLELDDVSSSNPELELYALAHARADMRLFST